ncbi:hypothetical protein BDY19DRAFT_910009 [Irpex rosettiformis]|uniref:Uncharacterized protein n=1 Tax=Irpex rosettiformis TaxID=378272 RepID=A0ACB8TQ21_9APHY|nr:hypothetical protein BDY19DRAFT_910009 [Irpex rosettiformis]
MTHSLASSYMLLSAWRIAASSFDEQIGFWYKQDDLRGGQWVHGQAVSEELAIMLADNWGEHVRTIAKERGRHVHSTGGLQIREEGGRPRQGLESWEPGGDGDGGRISEGLRHLVRWVDELYLIVTVGSTAGARSSQISGDLDHFVRWVDELCVEGSRVVDEECALETVTRAVLGRSGKRGVGTLNLGLLESEETSSAPSFDELIAFYYKLDVGGTSESRELASYSRMAWGSRDGGWRMKRDDDDDGVGGNVLYVPRVVYQQQFVTIHSRRLYDLIELCYELGVVNPSRELRVGVVALVPQVDDMLEIREIGNGWRETTMWFGVYVCFIRCWESGGDGIDGRVSEVLGHLVRWVDEPYLEGSRGVDDGSALEPSLSQAFCTIVADSHGVTSSLNIREEDCRETDLEGWNDPTFCPFRHGRAKGAPTLDADVLTALRRDFVHLVCRFAAGVACVGSYLDLYDGPAVHLVFQPLAPNVRFPDLVACSSCSVNGVSSPPFDFALFFPKKFGCYPSLCLALTPSVPFTTEGPVLLSVYPARLPDDSPVLRGLVPCTSYDTTRRSPQLPILYEYPSAHPSHRVKFEESRTYVYLVDPSAEGKAISDALGMAQGIPSGSEKNIPWLVDIRPGDAILARPIDRGGDPEYDTLQGLFGVALERTPNLRMNKLLAGSKYTIADVVERIDEYEMARDVLLGTRASRVQNHGKAAFEMDPRAEPVSNGPRCYPFNSMVQRTRQVEGLPATLKTVDNAPDDYQRNIHRYNLASTALNVLAWELQGPLHLLKATREYCEHINSPQLGRHDNYYWFPQQNNVASAQHPSQAHKFTDDQGFFSGVHRDKGDAVNGHSADLVGSDLPTVAEPGQFHLVGLGVYFRLTYMSQIFFTGLLPHGGTPPLIPEDVEIEGWETRMFLISYPASSMLNGEARHPYASLSYEEFPLYIPPEATGAPHTTREHSFWTNHVTYVQDGWVYMDARGLINFLVRAFIQLLFWVLKQVPAEYGVQNGQRVSADRWEFAPNADVQKPFGEVHKKIQDAFLKHEYNRLMQGIPAVVENKYRDWDVTTASFGGRPKTKASSKRPRTAVVGAGEAGVAGQPPQKKTRLVTVAEKSTREAVDNAFPMVATSLRPRRQPSSAVVPTEEITSPPSPAHSVAPVPSANSASSTTVLSLEQDLSPPSAGSTFWADKDTGVAESSSAQSRPPLPLSQDISRVSTVTVNTKTMSTSMLQSCDEVKRVVVEVTSGEYLKNALKVLDTLPTGLAATSSTAHMSESELVSCSQSLQAIKKHCHASSQWINIYRQHVMIFEAHMVASIRHLVDERCPDIVRNLSSFAGDQARCNWLVRLTTKVTVLVRNGVAVTASSQDYFRPEVLESRKFWEEPALVLRRKNLSPSKVESTVIAYMQHILYTWFGAETPFTTQAQSALVQWLVSRLGEGCLLLPLVWKLYVEVPQWIFTDECPRLHAGDKSTSTLFDLRYLNTLSTAID